eukprot:SM000020S06103  [mRNA]  locus=s20:1123230:1124000:- [translate_table: standard]
MGYTKGQQALCLCCLAYDHHHLCCLVADAAPPPKPPHLQPVLPKVPPCSHIPWYYPITVPAITVAPGTTCTWYYMDAAPVLRQHCVESVPPDMRIKAPVDVTGKGVFSYTFTAAGTYYYQDCVFLYTMNGVIIVKPATKPATKPSTTKGMHTPPTKKGKKHTSTKKGKKKPNPPPPKKKAIKN